MDDALIRWKGCLVKPPSLLHVSREGRSIGLEHYELGFGTNFRHDHGGGVITEIKAAPRIYINWEHDVMCLEYALLSSRYIDHNDYAHKVNTLAQRYIAAEKRIRHFAFSMDHRPEAGRSIERILLDTDMAMIPYWRVPCRYHQQANLNRLCTPQFVNILDFEQEIGIWSSRAGRERPREELLEDVELIKIRLMGTVDRRRSEMGMT